MLINRRTRDLLALLLIGTLTSILIPFPHAIANNTEGCPDTWKIDTSSRIGYQELLEVKGRLGVDLAISEPVIQYQNYSGELGSLKAPKDNSPLTVEDVYLYGKTQVLWKVEVQRKGCPKKTTFVINIGTLSESLGIRQVNVFVDPQEWANSNESKFLDFTRAAQFGDCVKSIQTRFSAPNLGIELQGKTPLVPSLNLIIRNQTFSVPCGVRTGQGFGMQDLSPECRLITESFGRSIALKKGTSCDISLTILLDGSLEIFPKYSLKAKDFEVVVLCTKGKKSKKVFSYKGYEFRVKCPSGYKKN